MSFALVLVYITVISNFFPVVAAVYNYRQLDYILKLMFVFCLISTIPDTTSLILTYLKLKYNTVFLMHFFDMAAVVFFTLIYHRAFYKPALKKLTLLLGGTSLIVIIFNSIFIESIWRYPSVSNTVLCVLLIVLSLTHFHQLLSRQEFTYIEKQSMFWINSGVLLYFAADIFLFMLYNKISSVQRNDYYMIQSIANIIANLLYSVGLLCKPQKTA